MRKKRWHSSKSDVYHDNNDCNTGNNIETENIQKGDGGHRKCKECKKIDRRKK